MLDQAAGASVGEVVGTGKQGRGLAMPGHIDMGRAPIHAGVASR